MSLTPPPSGECHPGNPKTLSTTPPYPKPTRTASPFGTAVPQTHPSPISPLAPPYPKPAPLPRTSPPTSPLLPNPLYNLSFLLSQCRLANTHRPSVPDSLSAGGNEPLPARRRAAAAPPGPPLRAVLWGCGPPRAVLWGCTHLPSPRGLQYSDDIGRDAAADPNPELPRLRLLERRSPNPGFLFRTFFSPPFSLGLLIFSNPLIKKKRHFLR